MKAFIIGISIFACLMFISENPSVLFIIIPTIVIGAYFLFRKSPKEKAKEEKTVNAILEKVEQVYDLAKKNSLLYPISIVIFPRRISSNYLACSIKLITNISQSDIASLAPLVDKSSLHLQVEVDNNDIVLIKHDSPDDITNFQSFIRELIKRAKEKHPDWNVTENSIFF